MANIFIRKQTRRQFFTGIGRYMTLGFIGFAAGSMLKKRRKLVLEGRCVNDYICAGCKLYEGCQLPEAISRRESVRGNLNADK
ncbi:MAG: hypothetical protein ACYTFM_08010 [Planctomycetota bacterium]